MTLTPYSGHPKAPDPGGVEDTKLDPATYWEVAQQLLFYKVFMNK